MAASLNPTILGLLGIRARVGGLLAFDLELELDRPAIEVLQTKCPWRKVLLTLCFGLLRYLNRLP